LGGRRFETLENAAGTSNEVRVRERVNANQRARSKDESRPSKHSARSQATKEFCNLPFETKGAGMTADRSSELWLAVLFAVVLDPKRRNDSTLEQRSERAFFPRILIAVQNGQPKFDNGRSTRRQGATCGSPRAGLQSASGSHFYLDDDVPGKLSRSIFSNDGSTLI